MARRNATRRITPGQANAQKIAQLEADKNQLATLNQQLQQQRRTLEVQLEETNGEVVRLEGELREALYRADHDPTTKLLRKEVIDHEIVRLLRSLDGSAKGRTAILYFDIDDFARFNSRFGHNIGDDVLRRVARSIKNSIRPGDLAGRGDQGDEFTVLLRDTTLEEANRIMEHICHLVASDVHGAHDIKTSEFVPYRVGISGGVAMYPGDVSLHNWKDLADKAMFAQKRNKKSHI